MLVGMDCPHISHAVVRATDATAQCTHLLELSGLAMALDAQGCDSRQYDIEVPRRQVVAGGRSTTTALLARDGVDTLVWSLSNDVITSPARFAGVGLRLGMARWAIDNLNLPEAEAALVLRRCAVISMGREYDLDLQVHAKANGSCFVQQPGRATGALRMRGTTWDFTTCPEALCAGETRWLAFECE